MNGFAGSSERHQRADAGVSTQFDAPALLCALRSQRHDLFELEEASRHFPGCPEWASYSRLHQRYVQTVVEVRDGLTREIAEQWARICIDCGQRLEASGLPLDLGIKVIREWTFDLRELVRAMRRQHMLSALRVTYPTPKNPSPLPPEKAFAGNE